MTAAPAIVVIGPSGLDVARRIAATIPGASLHGPAETVGEAGGIRTYRELGPTLAMLFAASRPIVGVCASGILVRLLAPHLDDKRGESPVVAVAEDGSVAVPLLGGHRGANRLARSIATTLGCPAAITTAGDVRLGLALDDPPPGWRVRNPEAAKAITSALLRAEPVALGGEIAAPAWLSGCAASFVPAAPLEVRLTASDEPGATDRLVLHPAVLALGVGCERGVDAAELIGLVEAALKRHRLARQAIACVASLELKAAEVAIHALAGQLGVPARFFPASRLEAETPRLTHPSAEVFAITGCHGVAEGAALAAAGASADLVVAKTRSDRATCAVARAEAPIDPSAVGRPRGHLALVGLGPGRAAWRTPEASALLDDAEDWVGYGGYLDLVGAPPPARIHRFALGEEETRVRAALDLAGAGRRVALICSGDPGIYAMAALVFELIERAVDPAWARVEVMVSPGISALHAAAARAGAPLGHDFCAISLSDLLTPWAEIERRLRAAAAGDFVTALYNPASGRRRQGIARALDVLSTARPPETPVVHARQLGRDGEQVAIDTLAAFDPATVDMLSLVIVGSSRTRIGAGLIGRTVVYTPRGYDLATAAAR